MASTDSGESSGSDSPGPLPNISNAPPMQKTRSASCEPASEVTYFVAEGADPMRWSLENKPKHSLPQFGTSHSKTILKYPLKPKVRAADSESVLRRGRVGSSTKSPYKTEVLTKKNLALFSALCEMQFLILNDDSPHNIFSHMLGNLLALMKCEFGWIGEIKRGDPKKTGTVQNYIRTFCVSNISWDEESEAVYNNSFLNGFVMTKLDTLYGYTLKTGKVLLTNDAPNDPNFGSLPPHHPEVRRYLGFPFYCKGELVGMAALVNCEREFTEADVSFLEPVMHSCAYAIGWLRDKAENASIRENEKLQCIKLEHESELNISLSTKLAAEKNKTTELLSSIIPTRLIDQVVDDPGEIVARTHPNVTVLFADIVNFTGLLRKHSPQTVLLMLNDVFEVFSDVASRYDIEKIKTVGDCFMAVGGLAHDDYCHPLRMCLMALEMNSRLNEKSTKLLYGEVIQARFGIAEGAMASGIVGRGRLAYDCWGDAVNIASVLESKSTPGTILVSEELRVRVQRMFETEQYEEIDIKGKGKVMAYSLRGKPHVKYESVVNSTCNPETHKCMNVEENGLLTSSAHGFKNVQRHHVPQVPEGEAHWMTSFIEGAIPVWDYSTIQQHVMIVSMFRYLNLLDQFKIDNAKFDTFVTNVFKCYNDNPYHNCEHSIDITHTTFLFLRDLSLLSCLWPHSVLALMIASLCHDLNHPGQNNNYQRKACTPLIFAYSSTSYLEEMHVVETFRLLSHSSSNILENMDADTRAIVLKQVKQMILATDFASGHNSHMQMFEQIVPELKEVISGKVKLVDSPLGTEENQQILLNMLLKASDVSNLVKPFPIAKEWAWRVSAEFFKQGDFEREGGLAIDPGFDRYSEADVNVALGQFKFNRFLHSMWEKLANAIPLFQEYVEISEENAKQWKALADQNAEIKSPLASSRQMSRESNGSSTGTTTATNVNALSNSRKMSSLRDLKIAMESANLGNQSTDTGGAGGLPESEGTTPIGESRALPGASGTMGPYRGLSVESSSSNPEATSERFLPGGGNRPTSC